MKIQICVLTALLAGSAFLTDTHAAPTASSTAVKPAKTMTAIGSVVTTDAIANTITIQVKKKSQWTFSIPATAKIVLGKKVISIGDIKNDSRVKVVYTKDGDALTASLIKLLPMGFAQ